MYTLGIDTSFHYLVLVIIKDDKVIDYIYEAAFKNQSELIFVRINELFVRNALSPQALEAVVVTKGPGSYTGVRIAMTIAKVYCSQLLIPLYTLSTLALYAGSQPTMVVMDARAGRAYVGLYNADIEFPDQVLTLEEVGVLRNKYAQLSIYGDGHLLNEADDFHNICEHFVVLRPVWHLVDNIHELTPEYLKDQNSYVANQTSNS